MYYYTVEECIYEECEKQTLGQVATDNDTEYYSLGENIWYLLLMTKKWIKICQNMLLYTLQYTTYYLYKKKF